MKEFFKSFISIIKIFLITLIITSIIGLIVFYIIYFDDIVHYRVVYKNFNLIKLILIKIDSFFYLFFPSVIIFTSFLTSFFVRKKIMLIRSFVSIIILNIIFITPIYIFILNSPSMIKKIKNAYSPVIKKGETYFEKGVIYNIEGNRYYFLNNKIIRIKNGNFNIYVYKYNINSNEILLYSKGKFVDKINFKIKKSNLIKKKIKYFDKLTFYFNEFYKFLLLNNKFFYLIYYFVILVLFILLPGIYSFDEWSFSELFLYVFLGLVFLFLFLLSFHFTVYYLIDLKIKKLYIYLFPVILFFIIDIIIILIENNRILKKKMLGRIRR